MKFWWTLIIIPIWHHCIGSEATQFTCDCMYYDLGDLRVQLIMVCILMESLLIVAQLMEDDTKLINAIQETII